MLSPAGPIDTHRPCRPVGFESFTNWKVLLFIPFLTCPVPQATSRVNYPYAGPEECPPGPGTGGAFWAPEPSLPPPLSVHYCAGQAGTPSGAGRIKARNFLKAGGGGRGGRSAVRTPSSRTSASASPTSSPRPARRDSLPARRGEEVTPGWSPPRALPVL